MCKGIGLPKVSSSSCLWQWWWSSREGSGRISLLCTALSFSGPAGHTLCRNSQIAKVTISKQHFHLSQGFRFPIWEVRSLLAVKTCSITILIQTLQTDRHSMEMSVINGLKNRKDFRREITLLNIESSPGPNHRKHRKSHCQLCLRNDVANLFLVHCILSRPTIIIIIIIINDSDRDDHLHLNQRNSPENFIGILQGNYLMKNNELKQSGDKDADEQSINLLCSSQIRLGRCLTLHNLFSKWIFKSALKHQMFLRLRMLTNQT